MVRSSVISTRPEIELLLSCARTCIDSQRSERIKVLIRNNIDWGYLVETSRHHGVIPLLYRNLKNISPDGVPETITEQLRNYFHTSAIRNLFLTNELIKILNLLEKHNIAAIPYKGPVLADSVYGNIVLRSFSDLDVLVHKRDILKIKDLLISHGYQPKVQMTKTQESNLLQSHYNYKMLCTKRNILIELHWAVTNQVYFFQPNPQFLWQRLKTVSFMSNTIVQNFAAEDLLLILCTHLAVEYCRKAVRLMWICDIAELIRSTPDMNWKQVINQADELNSRQVLFLGLSLAKGLLGATLPEEVLQRMQTNRMVPLLTTLVYKQLFLNTNEFNNIEGAAFNLAIRNHIKDRGKYFLLYFLKAVTPSERDKEFLPLPAFLYPFYYLIRPIRIIRNYGLHPLKSLLNLFLVLDQ